MPINLIQLFRLNSDLDAFLGMMQAWNLVPIEGEYACPNCNAPLKLYRDSEDGWRWRCNNKVSVRKQAAQPCGTKVRFRTGTFFAQSNLSYFNILAFAHLWAIGAPLRIIKIQLDIGSNNTLTDWASFCREVISVRSNLHSTLFWQVVFNAFITLSTPLGGEGEIVEIDESKFSKRKFHRGKRVEGCWVFGGFQRSNGAVFMVPVEDRSVFFINLWNTE